MPQEPRRIVTSGDVTNSNWAAWSAEAVSMMEARNRRWIETYQLKGAPYVWDLHTATIAFNGIASRVLADLCVVGTASKAEASFLWAWANEAIPAKARRAIDQVREFGQQNDLALLTTAELPGARNEGLEALAIAGRVLNADGVFIDEYGDLTLFFALFDFRQENEPRAERCDAGPQSPRE
jgi:hypothetical protein